MEYKVNIFGLKSLEPRMKGFIGDRNMYVLRDSKTGVALNTSFTEEGLKWSTNASGKLIYYKNAYLSRTYEMIDDQYKLTKVAIEGDLTMSDKVYIEKFIPNDHTKEKRLEILWEKVKDNYFGPKRREIMAQLSISDRIYVASITRSQVAEYTWMDKAYRLSILSASNFEA